MGTDKFQLIRDRTNGALNGIWYIEISKSAYF